MPARALGERDPKPFAPALAKERLKTLSSWELSLDARTIANTYVMKDFKAALRLINRIAELAESANHHPDLHLTDYRHLRVKLSTHAIGGLSEHDFILAEKIDRLPKALKT